MKMSVQSKSSRKHVPVIDISPLLKDGNSSSIYVSDVVKRIDKALRNEGLFYISGHGVPQTVTDDLMEAEKRFFEMPLEKKMAISVRYSKGYRGYVQKGSEKTSGKVDVKEGIYFGPDASPDDPDDRSDDPDVNSGKSLVGPNQFPDERDLPNFANVVKQYMDQLNTVGLSLMRAIAMGLQLKRDYFDDMFSNPSAWLALWSYPASPRMDSSWGIWPHTDPEMMTIILQDEVGGLEVQLPDSGEWIAVPPVPGTFVVNVGDPLEAWTKGLYRAGVHRVKSSPGKGRFSATFFYGPSYNCIIKPLDIDLTRNIDYSPEIRRRKLPCTYGDYYIKSFQNSLDWFK